MQGIFSRLFEWFSMLNGDRWSFGPTSRNNIRSGFSSKEPSRRRAAGRCRRLLTARRRKIGIASETRERRYLTQINRFLVSKLIDSTAWHRLRRPLPATQVRVYNDGMRSLGSPEMLVIFILALLLFGRRGGPRFRRPPVHPIPADDSRLLTRRRGPNFQQPS